MPEIEHERKLVEEWDALSQERDTLADQNTLLTEANLDLMLENQALKKRIEQLEAQLPPPSQAPLLWADDFTRVPVEGPDQYAIDAPTGKLQAAAFGGSPALDVFIEWKQRNAVGKCKSQFGPRFGEPIERPGRLEFRKTYWLGISFVVPADWQRDGSKCAFLSYHGTEDPQERGIGRRGALGFHVVGDRFTATACWSPKPIQEGNENVDEVWTAPYERGKPIRIVTQTRFDWRPNSEGGTGLLKLWVDGALKYERQGPLGFNDAEGPYLLLGLYHPSWGERPLDGPAPTPTWHHAFYQRLRFGDERHGYEDVA